MFKKDKKEKKLNVKKSTVIIIEVCVAVVVLLAALGIKYLVTNKSDNSIRLDNQVISNVTFSDFTISFEDDKSNISVNAINYSEEDVDIDNITVKLFAKDNTQVSEINFDFDYVLESNQEIELKNSTDLDLSGVTSVEYEVKLK